MRESRIDIQSGTISRVCDSSTPDAGDRIVFPGFVDLHVHAREYVKPNKANREALATWEAMNKKENFETAGFAAINGGVTAFVAMPNDPNPPEDLKSYSEKRELAQSCPCPVVVMGAVTRSSEPWEDIPYKVYLDPVPSRSSFDGWKEFNEVISRYVGCKLFFHAEDPEFINRQGIGGPRWRTRAGEAEFRAVDRILELTAKYGLRSHICHISTRKALELVIASNRTTSSRVTTEVTPHHIFFSISHQGVCAALGNSDTDEAMFNCNPPLRSEDDRRFLLEALLQGDVDCLATDHAPHTVEDKKKGAPGMPHLDTLGPFVGWLMHHCGFPPERIAQILAEKPADILKGYGGVTPAGIIRSGYAASFTVIDLGMQSTIKGSEILNRGSLRTKCSWSAFSGITLPASVISTVINGTQYLFGDNCI
jgi:dihydroorotase